MNVKIPYEAFFALYLIISSNYLGELFSCKFREFLSSNMIIKHLFGFMTFGFLVILTKIGLENDNFLYEGILLTLVLYIWFILSTRTHVYITSIIVLLFFVMYIINYRVEYLKQKKKSTEKLEVINKYILIITGVITILGVINYGYLKKRELNQRNETFSLFHFLIGNIKCRNDKIDTLVKINNQKLI
jgi:ABC-type multidrug transport system fused ATPase/permease subunit